MKSYKLFMALLVLIMVAVLAFGTVAYAEEVAPAPSEEQPAPTEPTPTESETPTEPPKTDKVSGWDILSEIWTYIVGCFGGITLTGLVSAVIYGALKGAFNKTIAKLDVEKMAEKATEKGIERVKEISFSTSIQPIVEARLKVITEEATAYLTKQLETMRGEYEKLLNILEALAAYFDYSIGVSDQAKADLHKALVDARNAHLGDESIRVEQVTVTDEKTATKANESLETAQPIKIDKKDKKIQR